MHIYDSKSLFFSTQQISISLVSTIAANCLDRFKMVKLSIPSVLAIKATICLFLLGANILCADSARILDELDQQPPVTGNIPQASNPTLKTGPASLSTTAATQLGGPSTILPSGQLPAAPATATADVPADDDAPVADATPPEPDTDAAPAAVAPPAEEAAPPAIGSSTTTSANPVIGGTASAPSVLPQPTPVSASNTVVPKPGVGTPQLSFFMHDILGGSHPSARVVAGLIANTDVVGLPFSKLNNNLFPITGGVPLVNPQTQINGLVNTNNLPFLVGLTGAQTSTVIQNTGTNNAVNGGNNQPFVTAGQLPSGVTVQKLMFGSVTVLDDELTEGHELGSAVIGRGQGFYMASSLDGTSQTILLTALFHGSDHHDEVNDTISFFGVHRSASPESQVALIGGTGKYENARGYATVETLQKIDQHTTDGVDTILHFNVYFSE